MYICFRASINFKKLVNYRSSKNEPITHNPQVHRGDYFYIKFFLRFYLLGQNCVAIAKVVFEY